MEALLCLKLEFMKFRKSFLKFIFILPAFLSSLMLVVGLHLRKNSFMSYGNLKDNFSSLLLANHSMLFWYFILPVFVISISISLFYIETSNNSLTAICSINLKRSSIYLGKWMFLILSTALMIILGTLILITASEVFKIPMSRDTGLLIRYMCFEFFSSLGLISFQLFLITIIKNIETACIVSLLAVVFFNAVEISKSIVPYIPYLAFTNSTPFSDATILRETIIISLIYSIIFLIIGILVFNFKDIKE